jgi:hypothetical protein
MRMVISSPDELVTYLRASPILSPSYKTGKKLKLRDPIPRKHEFGL